MSCGGIFDVDVKRERLTTLEQQMTEAGFWDNQDEARSVVQGVKTLKLWVDAYDAIARRVESARELDELLTAEPDDTMLQELDGEVAGIESDLRAFELKSLLQG